MAGRRVFRAPFAPAVYAAPSRRIAAATSMPRRPLSLRVSPMPIFSSSPLPPSNLLPDPRRRRRLPVARPIKSSAKRLRARGGRGSGGISSRAENLWNLVLAASRARARGVAAAVAPPAARRGGRGGGGAVGDKRSAKIPPIPPAPMTVPCPAGRLARGAEGGRARRRLIRHGGGADNSEAPGMSASPRPSAGFLRGRPPHAHPTRMRRRGAAAAAGGGSLGARAVPARYRPPKFLITRRISLRRLRRLASEITAAVPARNRRTAASPGNPRLDGPRHGRRQPRERERGTSRDDTALKGRYRLEGTIPP